MPVSPGRPKMCSTPHLIRTSTSARAPCIVEPPITRLGGVLGEPDYTKAGSTLGTSKSAGLIRARQPQSGVDVVHVGPRGSWRHQFACLAEHRQAVIPRQGRAGID